VLTLASNFSRRTLPARQAYVEKAPATGQRPLAEVVIATLGPDAGIIGAADLASPPAQAPPAQADRTTVSEADHGPPRLIAQRACESSNTAQRACESSNTAQRACES
jgi:hypothetical protein